MRLGHLLLILFMLTQGLVARTDKESEDATEKKHHYGKRIKELQVNLANLKAALEKDEARLNSLRIIYVLPMQPI
jgi:hypothetical protein